MNNAVELFTFNTLELRVVPKGDTFEVVATDVAKGLEVRDATTLLQSIPAGEKGYALVCTPGGEQEMMTLTEGGFYRAVGQRQAGRIKNVEVRERVEGFQSWVFSQMLPTVRRTRGAYIEPGSEAAEKLTNPETAVGFAEEVIEHAAARMLERKEYKSLMKYFLLSGWSTDQYRAFQCAMYERALGMTTTEIRRQPQTSGIPRVRGEGFRKSDVAKDHFDDVQREMIGDLTNMMLSIISRRYPNGVRFSDAMSVLNQSTSLLGVAA